MSSTTLNNLKNLVLWSYKNPEYECGLRLSSMLNHSKDKGDTKVKAYMIFGIKGYSVSGEHKDFGTRIKYDSRKDFDKDKKRGDWVAYDKKGVDPHFAWYLGKDRYGNEVYFESVGHIGDNKSGDTKYYLPNTRYEDKPFYPGPRDRERIQTAASIKDNGKEIKISNSIVSTFGTSGATYYKLPSKYDMTDEEWLELIDYIRDLGAQYKPSNDFLYIYNSPTDSEIFNKNNDTQGPISKPVYNSKGVIYHTSSKFDSAMRVSATIEKDIKNKQINITIKRDKQKEQNWWGGSW